VVCPECGTDNKPGARLCEFCQAVLSTAQPVGGPLGRPPALEAERKRAEAEAKLRRSRKRERVLVPILGAAGLVFLVCIFVFFPRKATERLDVAAQFPVAALNKYLGALEKGDYATAYAMLATPLRQRVTEEQFAALSVNESPEFWTYTKESEGWRITWCPAFEKVFGLPAPA